MTSGTYAPIKRTEGIKKQDEVNSWLVVFYWQSGAPRPHQPLTWLDFLVTILVPEGIRTGDLSSLGGVLTIPRHQVFYISRMQLP